MARRRALDSGMPADKMQGVNTMGRSFRARAVPPLPMAGAINRLSETSAPDGRDRKNG